MASVSRFTRAYREACLGLLLCATTAIPSPAQTFTNLFSFDGTDGDHPYAPLVKGIDGNLYGTTSGYEVGLGGTVFKITEGGKLTTLHGFCVEPNCADGATPIAGLVRATDGAFYGTTYNGGSNGNGTAFKITPGGKLTVLHRFCQTDCSDGARPVAGLIKGRDGEFYGTTYGGGASGNGTAFRMSPTGKVTTLHSFDGSDGAKPEGGLVQAPDGNLYGTTYGGGGTSNCSTLGCGTVFKITPEGKLTTLHVFCTQSYCPDGSNPVATLIEGADGKFYGTTSTGGDSESACQGGCGTVFKITPRGKLTTLHRFCSQNNCFEGTLPTGNLVQAADGNFYGTTLVGGSGYNCNSGYGQGCGTVFKIASGQLTTLHSFGTADAGSPWAGLVQDTDGSFYGTTTGGNASYGTVFSLDVGGSSIH
jgi:uncharacterized repeat protein (TIGR03803 family)